MKRLIWAVIVSVLLVWAVAATVIAATRSASGTITGSWAEWATAAVAFLALLAAGWAGFAAQGQLRAAQGQLRLMQDEYEARETETSERQARLVFVLHLRMGDGAGGIQHSVLIDNRSTEPISNVFVLFVGPENCNAASVPVVPGTTQLTVPILGELISDAAEKLTARVNFDNDTDRQLWRHSIAEMVEYEFPVVFTDARGQRWLRAADNSLIPKPPDYGGYSAQQEALQRSRFSH